MSKVKAVSVKQLLCKLFSTGMSGLAPWLEHLPPTKTSWVRFSLLASYLGRHSRKWNWSDFSKFFRERLKRTKFLHPCYFLTHNDYSQSTDIVGNTVICEGILHKHHNYSQWRPLCVVQEMFCDNWYIMSTCRRNYSLEYEHVVWIEKMKCTSRSGLLKGKGLDSNDRIIGCRESRVCCGCLFLQAQKNWFCPLIFKDFLLKVVFISSIAEESCYYLLILLCGRPEIPHVSILKSSQNTTVLSQSD